MHIHIRICIYSTKTGESINPTQNMEIKPKVGLQKQMYISEPTGPLLTETQMYNKAKQNTGPPANNESAKTVSEKINDLANARTEKHKGGTRKASSRRNANAKAGRKRHYFLD